MEHAPPRDDDTSAHVVKGMFCRACGWPIIHACCNDQMAEPPWGGDWWAYCSNKGCENHAGESWGQGDPEFTFRVHQPDSQLGKRPASKAVEISLEQARKILAMPLEHLMRNPLPNTAGTLAQIAESIYSNVRTMERRGQALMLAEGMRAAVPRAVSTTPDLALIQWRTEFFPRARFGGQAGNCMPLGFFGDFDLYIGFQWPLPPTLIARYGSAQHEYETFPAFVAGDLGKPPAHFAEAYQRAICAGFPPDGGDERSTAFFVSSAEQEITPLA